MSKRWGAFYAGDDLHMLNTLWAVERTMQQAMSAGWTNSRTCPQKAEVRAHLTALPLADCDCLGEVIIQADGKGTTVQVRRQELHAAGCTR